MDKKSYTCQATALQQEASIAMKHFWPTPEHNDVDMERVLDVWEAFSRWDFEGVQVTLLQSLMHGKTLHSGLCSQIANNTTMQNLKLVAQTVVTSKLLATDVYVSDLHGDNIMLLTSGGIGIVDLDLGLLPKVMVALWRRIQQAKQRWPANAIPDEQLGQQPRIDRNGYVSCGPFSHAYGTIHDMAAVINSIILVLSNAQFSSQAQELAKIIQVFAEYMTGAYAVDTVTGMGVGEGCSEIFMEKLYQAALDRSRTLGTMDPQDVEASSKLTLNLGCDIKHIKAQQG
jgi:hypothetical protein